MFVASEVDFSRATTNTQQVVSINVSGHKYGLVYPGVGWAVWRDPKYLPKGIISTQNITT
jgi:glutamate/tyrosine decarboxylase-like PLP-dependent enzyme